MRKVLAFIFAAIFIGSTAMAVVTVLRYKRAADELMSLAEALPEREAEPLDPVHVDPVKKEPAQTELATEAVPTEPEVPEFHRYDELYAQNPDLFGWIQIEGTVIDYPVMHTPDKPEKYLRKNFEGEYSVSGLPFMDAACYEGCGNYLVYGHHMSDKSMFATLLSYKDKSFWEEHQVVNFDLVTEPGTYQIFAVFYDEVNRPGDVFRYYEYLDLTAEEDFDYYLENVRAKALYDTGVDVSYGDELLTLSTCSYHVSGRNGRFVVVAKRIS